MSSAITPSPILKDQLSRERISPLTQSNTCFLALLRGPVTFANVQGRLCVLRSLRWSYGS